MTHRVTVLGGTGFVGRHIADTFAAAGYEVLTVARHRVASRHPFVPLDIATTTRDSLAAFLDSAWPEVVVDATGSSWGLRDAEMASRCYVLTERLLAALRRTRARPCLVHLGSILEYGPTAQGTPVNRGDAPPETSYGKAKLAASTAVLAATEAGRVDAVVLRLSNAVGPGLPRESLLGRVVDVLARAAEADEPAVVRLKHLVAHRDYLDVRDAADAVLAAATADATGQVLDIGSGVAVPVRDLVRLVVEISGGRAEIVEEPRLERDWRAAMEWIEVDPSRAREILHWRPCRSLVDAVRSLWLDESRRRGHVEKLAR